MHREEYGFGYLFSVGIPSAWDLSWFGHGHEDEYIGFVTYKKHSLKWFEVNASSEDTITSKVCMNHGIILNIRLKTHVNF